MELNDFQAVLMNLQDNLKVQQTTELYQSLLYQNPSAVVSLHFQNILSFTNPTLTSMSIILLKHIFLPQNQELLGNINSETLDLVGRTLPHLFESSDFTPYHLTLISDMSSTIASKMMQHQRMMDFIPFLLTVVKSMSPLLSPPAVDCIVQCHNFSNILIKKIVSNNDIFEIVNMVLQSFGFLSVDFLTAALRLLFSFYVDLQITPLFLELSPFVAQVYQKIPEPNLPRALSDLYVFTTQSYSFFSQSLPFLVSTLLSIVTGSYSTQSQTVAIDIFICLSRGFDVEFNPYLKDVTTAVMIASCRHVEEDICETDDAPYADVAIFHLSEIFGGRTMYPDIVIQHAKEMAVNDSWQSRRAALSAITQLLYSLSSGLDSYCPEIIGIITSMFNDTNHICRCFAFRAMSEFCSYYIIYLCEKVQILVPLFLSIFQTEPYHPAKVAELDALVAFCYNCPSDVISPFSQNIISQILPYLQSDSSSPIEQLQIIKCILNITVSTQINFEQFYGPSMTWLKTAFSQLSPGEENDIRIDAIKTIPLIGRAVPIQMFMQDGIQFLHALLQHDFANIGYGERSAILTAFRSLAEIMPETFVAFLPNIMNIINIYISAELEVEHFPLSFDMSNLTDRVTVVHREENEIVAYSRQQFTLIIECIRTLISLTNSLKEATLVFVRPISKIIANFVSFSQYSPLQCSSVKFLKLLIPLYRQYDSNALTKYIVYLRRLILPIFSFENSTHYLCKCLDLLADTIENSEFDGDISSLFTIILIQIRTRRMQIAAKGAHENAPDLVSLDELEFSLGNFARFCLIKFPDELFSFAPMILNSDSSITRILFITDMLRLAKQGDLNYLLNLINSGINSTRMSLCYAAFVSLAHVIICLNADQSIINTAIEKAVTIIKLYEDDENELPHKVIDGALITISVVLKLVNRSVDISSILPIWFEQMPITTDVEEANFAFEMLCIFVDAKNEIVFNPQTIAHLLRCFGEALKMKRLSNEVKSRISAIIVSLISNEEIHEIVQQAVNTLSVAIRAAIKSVL